MDLQKFTEPLKEKLPEMVKDNQGAFVGAVIGYLLSDNEKAKSSIMGAIAGALVLDKKKDEQ